MLVEDEQGVREATRRILARHGYTLPSAASAEETLDLFEEIGPAVGLLLTDVVMPGMSGKELVERVRQSHPGLRALYISGYTDDIVSRLGGSGAGARSNAAHSGPRRRSPTGLSAPGMSRADPRPRLTGRALTRLTGARDASPRSACRPPA